MKIVKIHGRNELQYMQKVNALENEAVYPLGNDLFKIDHGQDYFAFLKAMGRLRYYAAVDKEVVVAVGSGI